MFNNFIDFPLYTFALVFAGGALGAVIRFLLSLPNYKLNSLFPLGTLIANGIGCFIIGILSKSSLPDTITTQTIGAHALLAFLIIGFCGALTTFSSFIDQVVTLNINKYTSYIYCFITLITCSILFLLGRII
jgi:CrcB protein